MIILFLVLNVSNLDTISVHIVTKRIDLNNKIERGRDGRLRLV